MIFVNIFFILIFFISNIVFGVEEIINGPEEETIQSSFNLDLSRSRNLFFSLGAKIETPLAVEYNMYDTHEPGQVLNGVGFNNGVIFDTSFNQYISLGVFLDFGAQYMSSKSMQDIYDGNLKLLRSSFLTYGLNLKIYPTGNFWYFGVAGGGEYRSGGLISADASLNTDEIILIQNYSTGLIEVSLGGEISFNKEFFVNLHIADRIYFANQKIKISTTEVGVSNTMDVILGLTVGIVFKAK